jgi:hypothetical protein
MRVLVKFDEDLSAAPILLKLYPSQVGETAVLHRGGDNPRGPRHAGEEIPVTG